jgi:hypothetical protein
MPRTSVFGARTLPHRHVTLLRAAGVPVAVVPDARHAMTGENPDGVARIAAETPP